MIFPLFLRIFSPFLRIFPLFLRFSLLLLKDKGKQQQFTAKMGNFTPTPSAPTPCKTSRRRPTMPQNENMGFSLRSLVQQSDQANYVATPSAPSPTPKTSRRSYRAVPARPTSPSRTPSEPPLRSGWVCSVAPRKVLTLPRRVVLRMPKSGVFQRLLTRMLLQKYRDANGRRIVIQSGGVNVLLSAKRRAYFCKSIAIGMGGVSRYFSKVSGPGSM